MNSGPDLERNLEQALSLIKVAAAGALFMGVDIPAVLAASVTQPGETGGTRRTMHLARL